MTTPRRFHSGGASDCDCGVCRGNRNTADPWARPKGEPMRQRLIEALEALEKALDGWDRDYLPELRVRAFTARGILETVESELYLLEKGN